MSHAKNSGKYHTGTVSRFVENKVEALVTLHVVFTPVRYKRMYGALSGIPVEALDLLLDSKRVIFGRRPFLPLRAVPMLSDSFK